MLCRVVTCLPCGYRETVPPGRAYPPRCPNDGQPLEHADFDLTPAETRTVCHPGRDTRRPTRFLRQVR